MVETWGWHYIKCCHTGDHPQGDLAMFGYRLVMKVEIY